MGRSPVIVVTVLMSVFSLIFLPVLLSEGEDWLPWVAIRLMRRAAGHLPLEYRARYVQEWMAEFRVLPGGKLTKLFFGLRVYAGARRTAAEVQKKLEADKAARNMDMAARVLQLAQQTADQAIADARREADEHLGRARREADEILGRARRQAKQIRAKAKRSGGSAYTGTHAPGEPGGQGTPGRPRPGR
jgi:hypothetical protein